MAKEPAKYERKKVRKPRKPMTAEQKAAATERLRLAREKRAKDNPPEYKNIHPTVLALDKDDPLSMDRVKDWIKTQRVIISEERKNLRNGIKGSEAKVARAEGYARQMQRYLEDSVWTDGFYGEHGTLRMNQICTTLAYEANGDPKRTYGVFYPDLGYVYGVSEERGGKPEYHPEPEPESSLEEFL